MANFMYQLDGATGCLDVWTNIILGVSVNIFLDEINFKYRLRRANCLPQMWVGLIQSTEDQTITKTLSERELCLPGDIHLFWTLDLDRNNGSCVSCLLAFRLEIHIVPPGSLARQLQGLRFLSLHNHVSQPLTINPFRWTDIYLRGALH